MTLEDWCETKRITGNEKRALYTALKQAYGDKIYNTTEYDWAVEWNFVRRYSLYGLATGYIP